MQQYPLIATGTPRRLRRRALATALLAALTTLALIGCPAATPASKEEQGPSPVFLETMDEFELTYPAGREIGTLLLPPATAGRGALTYSLSPDVPGLTFDANARTLSGTPTEAGDYAMAYRVTDAKKATATLNFTITVEESTVVRTIVSAVAAGDAEGRLRFENVPAPGGGPATAMTGNIVVTRGGSFFVDVDSDRPADKLLVSIGGEAFGYYEVDVDSTRSPHRLTGQLPFNLDPALSQICLEVTAVDDSGAAGPPACHTLNVAHPGGGEVQITVSWDVDADLDLHVLAPDGDEVYFGNTEGDSGGVLDLASSCVEYPVVRNEHIGWSAGTPLPGRYVVRVNHWESCEVEEIDYIVSIYNHGRTSTFSGTFTGPGNEGGRGSGRVITTFEVPGAQRAPVVPSISSTYRGSGDQVFVLNPDGEILRDTLYTLTLGNASADVYVIAANRATYPADPHVERLDILDAQAKGRRAAATEAAYEPQPRAWKSEPVAERDWVVEFNNNPPFLGGSSGYGGSLRAQSQEGQPGRVRVAEGDRYTFRDRDDDRNLVEIPSTARKVVTDGAITLALWVADSEWHAQCGGADKCVTQEMVDAAAQRFLRPGAGNDIYDWVTNVFGAPWGPYDPFPPEAGIELIPPEAADEIHIFLFDVDDDGIPEPGESRIIGFFWGVHSVIRQEDHALYRFSNERLLFVLDSALLAARTGETWEVSDRWPSIVIGTLAHEFQHMIHSYQKTILRHIPSATWLNEMASEVAEDLIADRLMIGGPRGVAYDDPTAGEPVNSRGRLPRFNVFNDMRVTTWNGSLANYSINYALGAYLARTYGAELFSRIVQSDAYGVAAIEGALRGLGQDVSFGDTLENWAVATLLSDNTAAPARSRYNPGTWATSHVGGLEYRLGSIDLFNYAWLPPGVSIKGLSPDQVRRMALFGPYLHSLRTFNARTQPPHSNMYATIGRATGTVRLNVSAGSDNRIMVVVKE